MERTKMSSLHPFLTDEFEDLLVVNKGAFILFNSFMGSVFFGHGPELTELRRYWNPLNAFELYSRLCNAYMAGDLSDEDWDYSIVETWMDDFRIEGDDRGSVLECFAAMGGHGDRKVLTQVMIEPMVMCDKCGGGVCPCCGDHIEGEDSCISDRDIGMLN